jgi:hypothetical protein
MGHHLSAVILKGCFDPEISESYDLQGIALGFDLTLFPMSHYYTACWAKTIGVSGQLPGRQPEKLIFLSDRIIAHLLIEITNSTAPLYAIIATNYFGGNGKQWALVYQGTDLADDSITQISSALQFLGVKQQSGMDEFDTVGLGKYRFLPGFLDKYIDLADHLGV